VKPLYVFSFAASKSSAAAMAVSFLSLVPCRPLYRPPCGFSSPVLSFGMGGA
jgi:hypothetical protein